MMPAEAWRVQLVYGPWIGAPPRYRFPLTRAPATADAGAWSRAVQEREAIFAGFEQRPSRACVFVDVCPASRTVTALFS
jgi:hypothetical protein